MPLPLGTGLVPSVIGHSCFEAVEVEFFLELSRSNSSWGLVSLLGWLLVVLCTLDFHRPLPIWVPVLLSNTLVSKVMPPPSLVCFFCLWYPHLEGVRMGGLSREGGVGGGGGVYSVGAWP